MHALHQADLERLDRTDAASAEGQLLGLRHADKAHEPERRAGIGHQTAAREHRAEACALGGKDEVASEGQAHARANCRPVNGGDAKRFRTRACCTAADMRSVCCAPDHALRHSVCALETTPTRREE